MKKLKLTEQQLLAFQADGSFSNYLAFCKEYKYAGTDYRVYVDSDSGHITFSVDLKTYRHKASLLFSLDSTRLYYSLIKEPVDGDKEKRLLKKHRGVLKNYEARDLILEMQMLRVLV